MEILEYCDRNKVISREQFYFDQFKPEYNILSDAGSSLGYLHTKTTKYKMSIAARGRKHSEETKKKLKARLMNKIVTPAHKVKLLNHLTVLRSNVELQAKRLTKLKLYHESVEFKEHINRLSKIIEVYDSLNKQTTVYPSITQAAEGINCVEGTISLALKVFEEKGVTRMIKKRYLVYHSKDKSKFADMLSELALDAAFSSLKNTVSRTNANKVEVLDTLENKTTIYFSIREAAKEINCSSGTIINAINYFKEKGETKLTKKIYRIKPVND